VPRLLDAFLCDCLLLETATVEIYTLSLHDALPISGRWPGRSGRCARRPTGGRRGNQGPRPNPLSGFDRLTGGPGCHVRFGERCRSEEHTSELQSRENLVCRLLLEKQNKLL